MLFTYNVGKERLSDAKLRRYCIEVYVIVGMRIGLSAQMPNRP